LCPINTPAYHKACAGKVPGQAEGMFWMAKILVYNVDKVMWC